MSKAWMCLAYGSERQYGGNEGYEDLINEHYHFDSFVPNHKQIRVGDTFFIRNRCHVLGVAQVVTLRSEPSTRIINRCPVCRVTGIKERKNKKPKFRCNGGHEFEFPNAETVSCIRYEAGFGKSFRQPLRDLSIAELKESCRRYSDQLSIQEIDMGTLENVLPFSDANISNIGRLGIAFSKREVAARMQEQIPFSVDPDKIDNATSSHANLQNILADWVLKCGLSPRLPALNEPFYDIAWEHDVKTYVCEVKSTNPENEEKQLRLALGQILRYRHCLEELGRLTIGVIMVQREPSDRSWVKVCDKAGVQLLWPEKILNKDLGILI